ncbi:hypothetical protein ACOANN_30515 [Pseudomonas aeruginosa]|uniref:hypothetical protein n=1 Tax=Pseudomonas aeruginosa TaxID=287 RepID=UPI000E321090|nr:hypothetical protein [Pseudomonas aeruginosa]NQC59430.1 hypothetical protein [Pseudomonas aeruginosa]
MIKRTLYHFHFCCGLGGGNVEARWECLGGIDVGPAGLRDFERLVGDTLYELLSASRTLMRVVTIG